MDVKLRLTAKTQQQLAIPWPLRATVAAGDSKAADHSPAGAVQHHLCHVRQEWRQRACRWKGWDEGPL